MHHLLLMRNKGKIVSRDRIMRVLWESEYFISENTLTVNVNRLRKRLEDVGLKDFIVTKKAQGKMMRHLDIVRVNSSLFSYND